MLNMLTRCTSVSRDNLSDTRDGRRESEAVIHGIFVFIFLFYHVVWTCDTWYLCFYVFILSCCVDVRYMVA